MEEVPWLGEPPGAQHWANGARLGKNPVVAPVALVRRAGVEPLHRPARAALGQHRRPGPGDARRAAGRPRRHRPPAPRRSPPSCAAGCRTSWRSATGALRACTQTYERRRWAPGALEPHADALWRASAGYLEVRDALAALDRLTRRCPRRRLTVRHWSLSAPRAGALPWGGRTHGTQPAARPPRQRGRLVRALAALPLVLGLCTAHVPGRPVRDASGSRHLLAAVPASPSAATACRCRRRRRRSSSSG